MCLKVDSCGEEHWFHLKSACHNLGRMRAFLPVVVSSSLWACQWLMVRGELNNVLQLTRQTPHDWLHTYT